MRKILTVISVLSLISFNANALERSDLSATIGLAANSAVYGASAKETNRDESNTVQHIKNESGVFTESHTSGFIELNVGEFISVGYEHTPDSISTPTFLLHCERSLLVISPLFPSLIFIPLI